MGQLIDREALQRGTKAGRFQIESGQVLSPNALEWAREQGIDVVRAGSPRASMPRHNVAVESLSDRITQRFVSAGVEPGAQLIDAVAKEVEAIANGEKAAPVDAQKDDPQMLACLSCGVQKTNTKRERVVVTSAGRNQRGIIAALTKAIADHGTDILDMSQTLVGDFFTAIIVIDIASSTQNFDSIREALLAVGKKLNVHVAVIHDAVLQSMHRI